MVTLLGRYQQVRKENTNSSVTLIPNKWSRVRIIGSCCCCRYQNFSGQSSEQLLMCSKYFHSLIFVPKSSRENKSFRNLAKQVPGYGAFLGLFSLYFCAFKTGCASFTTNQCDKISIYLLPSIKRWDPNSQPLDRESQSNPNNQNQGSCPIEM